MNDVLYNLYNITGEQKHLTMAHLFDKPCFLGFLAVKADSLSGFHANTHIPIVVGAQRRYEITGDTLYREMGTYFMDIVNSSHAYATGGTSVNEFWSDPKRLADTLTNRTEESCTTYNMLKVSRNLFRWTKGMAYADYYERTLINGVLPIQRGREPGVMIYFFPQGPGQSKAVSKWGWGTQFDSFWCCYGTGIESFSKLGDSIYFEEKGSTPGLYIIQYIPSSFNWKSRNLLIKQKMKYVASTDAFLQVLFTISPYESKNQASTLNLRIPSWTTYDGATVKLNGQALSLPYPGNFFSITRNWTSNDFLFLQFPISLRTEAIKDNRAEFASIHAILFGPYLLAGLTSGDWNITANPNSISDSITAIPTSYNSQLISLFQISNSSNLVLSNSNGSLSMDHLPQSGTDLAVHATFRVVARDPNPSSQLPNAERVVALEPFDQPGMVVMHRGSNESLVIGSAAGSCESEFLMVAGLDGTPNTVSLESAHKRGCFAYSDLDSKVRLACGEGAAMKDPAFLGAASFKVGEGLRRYHPISFTVKGFMRNFLLVPLLNLKDESYTVYFNMGV